MHAIANPYWDAVSPLLDNSWAGTPTIGGLGNLDSFTARHELTDRYSWSVPDPDTISFVVDWSNGKIIDPMAGSGYWAWILTQCGVDVVAYDANPPDKSANHWHKSGATHTSILAGDAADAVLANGDRTLFLSWPPYNRPDGARTVAAYPGTRIIYIGESDGGCTGDGRMFELLARDWEEVAEHCPVQWYGIHDYVTVYDRKHAW